MINTTNKSDNQAIDTEHKNIKGFYKEHVYALDQR